ncbi:MAG: L-rhamnose mutarotase [Clostridia bacterium]|nr:L-rhamnose mutarotase [Clostridia bacterium]
MKRFTLYSDLLPEKVEDYIKLHSEPWPELMALLEEFHIHHYSISVRGTQVFTYYEYTGNNYEADMDYMDKSEIMQSWWKFSKPCFLHHDVGHYYANINEVFYKE